MGVVDPEWQAEARHERVLRKKFQANETSAEAPRRSSLAHKEHYYD